MAKKKVEVETVVETKKTVEPPTEEQVKAVKEANEARNNDRVNRLNAIADGNDEAHKEELIDTDGEKLLRADPDETERKAAEEDERAQKHLQELDDLDRERANEESRAEREEKQESEEASDTKVVNGVTHYLQIVNGKEKWQTLEEIRRTASKVDAADEYLTTAKEAATNAARLALSQDEQSSVEEVDIEDALNSTVMGEKEAIKKVASAIVKARPSAVTPDVLQQIDDRLMFRQAVDWFSDEYSDVLSDPYLKRLVTEKDSELAQAEPQLSYRQRLKKAGDEIRGWKQKITGVTATSSQDKIARKKTLVNAPSAAGKQVERTEEQEEESLEITIDKMAKARGQPQSIRHAKH